MKHIPWPSIGQFRSVVKNVQHRAQYVGMDDNGDAIVNRMAVMPTLEFEGTTKCHGTNASVGITPKCEFWAQSRENIITPEKDNAGFALFAYHNEDAFQDLASSAVALFSNDFTADRDFVIFGEWCGGSIQGGVALNQLPKMFVIFGMAFVDAEGQKTYLTRNEVECVVTNYRKYVSYPHQQSQELSSHIYCIYDFPTWKFTIDFENPHHVQNELNAVMTEVETECPVGKAFGVSGVGEGIVIRCVTPGWEDSGYWFKVKGEKHSKSKVKTLATVDIERINDINELAEQVAHNGRLEQMAQTVFDLLNGGEYEMEKMGPFIKAVMQDIAKEDLDGIAESGFTMKEISGPVSKICRNFVMQNMEM